MSETDSRPPDCDTRVESQPRVRLHVTERWKEFWFADVPSEAFALMRIAVGVAGIVNLIGATPVAMFWSLDGIAPIPGGGSGLRSYVLESGLGMAAGWAFFLTLFASFICMTAGLFTSVSVLMCFVGSLLQMRWNVLPLTSGHGVLVNVLFFLIWANCGARLSVDERRRRRQRDQCAAPPADLRDAAEATSARQPIWPLRLIQLQVAIIYLTSGLFKLLTPMWRGGSAVYYTTGQNVYGRIFHLYPVPPSFDWVLTVLTYSTVLWEISFPLLLLTRMTRRIAIATGIAMHLGIWATMEVGPFTLMMLASYVAFLNPHTARRLVLRTSKQSGATASERIAAPLPPSSASTA